MDTSPEKKQNAFRLSAEWICVSVVVALLLALLYAVSIESQPANEEVWLSNYHASPSGTYDHLVADRFTDYGNNNYFVDPSALSRMNNITIKRDAPNAGGWLEMRNNTQIKGVTVPTPQKIDLNASGNNVSMDVFALSTETTITMGAPAPPGNSGDYIYDIAEGMDCRGAGPGDVVTIAPADGVLVPTLQAYSRPIAGVISADPKLYMGPGQGKQPLALGGIVRCKVTAENGPIGGGDLLVSASVPGHAMRADSSRIKPGMLVGTALEPLSEKDGEICILVNKH